MCKDENETVMFSLEDEEQAAKDTKIVNLCRTCQHDPLTCPTQPRSQMVICSSHKKEDK